MSDILSALLLPTERPPTAIDIKRALLVFDQVHVLPPDDRDFVSRGQWAAAAAPFPLPFSIDIGPALPLGKIGGYDRAFESALDECKEGIEAGSIIVRNPPPAPAGLTLGAAPPPQGWPNPRWVVQTFRGIASSTELMLACIGSLRLDDLRREDPSVLAPLPDKGGAMEINFAGSLPVVSSLDDPRVPEDMKPVVRVLAAARLASLVKALGMCEVGGLHLFSTDAGLSSVLDRLHAQATKALEPYESEAEAVRRASRVERLIFDQYLPDSALDAMSLKDVLKSRTAAWGRAGERRQSFFATIRRLSEETESDEAFDRAAREEIKAYVQAQADLADEWKKLGLRVGLPALGAAIAEGSHLLEQLCGISSWDSILTIASLALIWAGKLSPEVFAYWRQHQKLDASTGKALLTPYVGVKF